MCENQCCIVASAFFSLLLSFFQKFHICVQKSVLHCCVTPFHLFPKKIYMYVSRCVLHCCMRKDSCIRKKLNFFGGRMLMCENQCCVVASAFSAFSHLFSKNFIYAFENQCCVVASAFSSYSQLFPKNLIYVFENQCCLVASWTIDRKKFILLPQHFTTKKAEFLSYTGVFSHATMQHRF